MIKRLADSHVHFWEPNLLSYKWLAELPSLNRPFLPKDLAQAASNLPLDKIIFIQADCIPDDGLREVEWVCKLAADEPRISAIVAFAPLEQAHAGDYVSELCRYPLVKGVRRLIQSESKSFAAQPDFVRGVQMLANFDLSFDICIRHKQLEAVIEMVRQCPDVHFVLDHAGKPGIKDQILEPWATNLRKLGKFPNVSCKLSGLVTEADLQDWSLSDLQPYIDQVLAVFGPGRVMFGGDWPVLELAANYPRWVDTSLLAIKDLSETEQDQIFYANACAFYRLDL